MTSVVVASTAFGFGLATALCSADSRVAASGLDNGAGIVSPGSDARDPITTGAIRAMPTVVFSYRSLDTGNAPAVNMVGPVPGVEHVNLGRSRAIASTCLMAMN